MRALILAPFAEPWLRRLRERMDVTYESWLDTNRLHDPEELGARLAREGVSILVVEADFVFSEVFEAAPGLRVVGVCRNALNHVDIGAATEHGVAVLHAPGRNTNAVAEMTIGLMLALGRMIVPAHALVSGGGWRDPATGYRSLRGREIAGSTVGVIGFGRIGREVSRKCLALGARVVAHDPIVPDDALRDDGAEPRGLNELAREADFVTIHVPEHGSTRGLIGERFLGAMRRTAFLVNTSAGSVIDTGALVRALEAGQIAGAALDVFEGQPLPQTSELLSAPNVLLTPHIAGATDETVERHSRMMVEDIERYLAGQPMRHVINPEYAASRAG